MRLFSYLLAAAACAVAAGPGRALTITGVSPSGYQTVPLIAGASCYVDNGSAIVFVPPALQGATLVQTRQSDAANPSLSLQFTTDLRSEVYVCFDTRGAAPAWLAPWLPTEMVLTAGSVQYRVYARRYAAGSVSLGLNTAPAMYFVAVKESVPAARRNGWVLLSYDMPYLREIVKHAPEYGVNHLQLSHDIVMFAQEVLQNQQRRADINEIIELAHAYGVGEVTLWTHEISIMGMPAEYFVAGKVDGNNADMWSWMQGQYEQLFAAQTGCPDIDGLVLTFDELSMFHQGVEVYDRDMFKHDGYTSTQSLTMVIDKLQDVCRPYGKTLYVRTWGGSWQDEMRDAIGASVDSSVWMMNKNVGDPNGRDVDWLFMDSYNPLIGTLPGRNEMIEFDIGGEYLGRGHYTFIMTSYLKEHWARALQLGADGAVARIDRGGSLPYYTANRASLYALAQIVPNPDADPAAVNLAFCNQYFPPDMAQDIAWSYDAPDSPWNGDTRYLTWEAFQPGLNDKTTQAQAIQIGQDAIRRIDAHRSRLELQCTLNTRFGRSDYETLHDGIAAAVLDLQGTVPASWNFRQFTPQVSTGVTPDCSIQVRADAPGLRVSSVACEYSVDGGASWNSWPAYCTGANGSLNVETITAAGVPFNQASETLNYVRFHAETTNLLQQYNSGAIRVVTINGPRWGLFRPTVTSSLVPVCGLSLLAGDLDLVPGSARYALSIDGGATWPSPTTVWTGRYEANNLPTQDGWYRLEGYASYARLTGSGELEVIDPSGDPGSKLKYARDWTVVSDVGATVLARMRCVSGGHPFAGNIFVSDGVHSEGFYLKACGLAGLCNCGALARVDTTQYHVYRLTIAGTDLMVYYDENPYPLINAKGSFLLGANEPARLVIGSGASDAPQDVYYDYVYWTTAGAFPPGCWRGAEWLGGPDAGTIAAAVPFNQRSSTLNKVRFRMEDVSGHTLDSPVYNVRVGTAAVWADLDCDGDVDQEDFAIMQACVSDEGLYAEPGCEGADPDGDGDVDAYDLQDFADCLGGPDSPPGC